MNAEDIEFEYNPRVSVSNVQRYIDQASLDSERAREILEGFYDVPYGEQELMTCDIFPAGPDAPVHVFYHGGYWKGRDKSDYSFIVPGFLAQGITVVIPNYGLCPDVDLATIVRQTSSFFYWLKRNAAEYGGNADRITTSGHSAGAHLLAMALAPDFDHPIEPGLVRTAVLVSGIYDIAPVLRTTVNDDIRLTEMSARALSPMGHLPHPDVALRIVAGGSETRSWVQQSRDYHDIVRGSSPGAELEILDGHDHFSIIAELANPASRLSRICIESALST